MPTEMQGVTALACTSDSCYIVSGGGEGQVRIWDITPKGQYMKEALKEHKGAVTCIKIRRNDEEVEPLVQQSVTLFKLCIIT